MVVNPKDNRQENSSILCNMITMEANARNYGDNRGDGSFSLLGVWVVGLEVGGSLGVEEAEMGKVDFHEVEQGNMAFWAEGRTGGPGVGKALACWLGCESSLQETLGESGWETCRGARSPKGLWPCMSFEGMW